MGNPNKSHKYTVQCVLPINLFNQQIFTVIWFWYSFVLIWNIMELIKWIGRSLPNKSYKWVSRRVSLINKSAKIGKKRLDHFLKIYLESDGIFMIRMIANNTSDYVAFDLIKHLWCQHAELYDFKFPEEPHNYPDIPCEFKHKPKEAASSENDKDSSAPLVTESSKFNTVNGKHKLNHDELGQPQNYLEFSKVFLDNKFKGAIHTNTNNNKSVINPLLNINNKNELVQLISNGENYQRQNRGQMYYDNTDDPSASVTTTAIRNANYNSRLLNSGADETDEINDENNPFPRRRDVNQTTNATNNNSTNV